MITQFAEYDEPKLGDWVLARIDDKRRDSNPEWTNKVENSAGQVVGVPTPGFNFDYRGTKEHFKGWKLQYDWNDKGEIAIIFKREIAFFNKDRDIIDAYIESKKYNL